MSKNESNKKEAKYSKKGKKFTKQDKSYRYTGKKFDAKSDAIKENRNHGYSGDSESGFFREPDASTTNDIKWWNKTTAVYDQAVKVPFNRIMGDPIVMGNGSYSFKIEYPGTLDVPGAMVVNYIPTIGPAADHQDAVNMAFDALWARIYREYTGAEKFTKSELAFHVLHCMNIAIAVGEAKRILRCINSYAQQNHNFPRVLYAAMTGGDTQFDSIAQNIPMWTSRLNKVIYNFNSLFVPNFTDSFDRWYSLASNVWMDEDLISGSAYLFRSMGYYHLVEGTGQPESDIELDWVSAERPSAAGWLDDLLSRAETLLGEIRNSTNFAIVNAAIAKVYFGSNLRQIQLFNNNESLQPVFDRNMMYQVNNMNLVGYAFNNLSDRETLNVTENVLQNTVICKPRTITPPNLKAHKHYLLNSYDSNIDGEFVMESTRLKPYINPNADPDGMYALDCGTEIPYSVKLYYYAPSEVSTIPYNYQVFNTLEIMSNDVTVRIKGIGGASDTFFTDCNFDSATSMNLDQRSSLGYAVNDFSSAMLMFIAVISKFRNHPYFYLNRWGYDVSTGATRGSSAHPCNFATIGDVTTYTMITDEGLRGLHEAALLSIYNVV